MALILTTAVNRYATGFFVLIAASALWAFWPGYFSDPSQVTSYYVHAHGIVMSLWIAMLVSQAWLVTTNRRDLHRRIGKAAYVLAPAVFLTLLGAIHDGLVLQSRRDFLLLGFTISNALLFGTIAGLALYHRRVPAVHARYMLCTPLPMFAPIFSRILGINFGEYLGFLPTLEGAPITQVVAFAMSDGLLLALAVWEWRSPGRYRVFAPLLVTFVLIHVALFAIFDTVAWRTFAVWFLDLPLT